MAYQNYPATEHKNLRELLFASAEIFSERIAFYEKRDGETVSYTYRRCCADAVALNASLAAKGLADRRIVIAGANGYAWATAFFAVTIGPGCAVSVDRATNATTLAHIVSDTEAAAVICSPDFLSKTDALDASVVRISFDDLPALIEEGNALLRTGNGSPIVDIKPSAPAAIFFTTGSRKGVVLSHRNLCFDTAELCRMIRFTADDLFLSVLPIHHAYETTCGFLVPLSSGAAIAFSEGLRSVTREMKEYHPTVINCVPYIAETMYRKVEASIRRHGMERSVLNMIRVTNAIRPEKAALAAKRRAFSFVHQNFGGKLRLILTSGAPADPAVLRGFRNYGILALQAYTLVECSPVAAVNRDRFFDDSSAGISMPDTLVDIYDMQEDGMGEIRCKGNHIMLGYYNDPEATAKVLRDGWFYTGDLGYLDADGFLHIVGRKQNMIVNASGKQIFPEEIESLLDSTKYIREALVRAVPNEDGDDIRLEAVLFPDADTIDALGDANPEQRTVVEMRRAISEVNEVLPSFKQISSYVISDTPLPKSPSGSLKRG